MEHGRVPSLFADLYRVAIPDAAGRKNSFLMGADYFSSAGAQGRLHGAGELARGCRAAAKPRDYRAS